MRCPYDTNEWQLHARDWMDVRQARASLDAGEEGGDEDGVEGEVG